ncbi:MAG: sorbosone dehydrogenase [Chromatiales bacterium]|nr:sorbosone dehydrogenase [Chromatiales bacterium]
MTNCRRGPLQRVLLMVSDTNVRVVAVAIMMFAAVTGFADEPLPPIVVPDGFSATVFHPGLGATRHLAVRENGDVYVARSFRVERRMFGQKAAWGTLIALRDEDADGVADIIKPFGPSDVTTEVRIHDGHLYFSSDQVVYRMALDDNLVPQTVAEPLAGGFPMNSSHGTKTLAFDGAGNLYVNSGTPSNACESKRMALHAPGLNPCPHRERSAGIWKFRDDKQHQDQVRDGERYVTGTRNIVAMAWNPWADKLFFVMHGRDSIGMMNPDFYSKQDNAEIPAEEFHVAEAGDDFGWPYTYYDPRTNQRMRDPGYGGDGKAVADGNYKEPLIAFPAHWAPNDLLFHSGRNLPARYAQGAFIVFHGSWNRIPFEQGGFKVVFVPMQDGRVTGDWEVFADGFTGSGPIKNPGQSAYRPTGLAEGPDGAIYITEDMHGRIWKVSPE